MSALSMRAALASFTIVASFTACQIDDADVPKFGGPCSNGCANGFRCDQDLDACVPEEEPTDGGFPDAGFPDAGNPALLTFTVEAAGQEPGSSVSVERGESFTLTWETQDLTDCSITAPVGPVGSNADTTLSISTPGTHSFVLTCTGNGSPVASDPVTVNVNTVLDGDLIVLDVEDLNVALGITEVTGNVVIEGASIAGVAQLATLVTVGGDFRFVNTQGVDVVTLPSLATIDGSLILTDGDPALEELRFPALTAVGEDLRLEDLPSVEVFSAPNLASIGRDLFVGRYTYPQFPDVYDYDTCIPIFESRPVPALTTLELPLLATIGRDFGTEEATALRSLSLPSLTSVGATMLIWELGEFASGKTTLDLSALETASTIIVYGNSNLGTVDLSALDSTARIPAADAQDFDAPLTDNLPSPLFHVVRATSGGYCGYGLYYPTTGDTFIYYNGASGNDAIDDLRLDSLRYLAGGFVYNAHAGAELVLPELESVDFMYLEYGGTTGRLSFPALTTIRSYGLQLYELPATSITFPVLTDITGSVVLNPGTGVTEFALPATDLSSLQIRAASGAVMDGLSVVTVTGELDINGEFTGTSLSGLSGLTSVGEDLDLSYVTTLADATGLEMLTTVGGRLLLPESAVTTQGLEALETVGSLSISRSEGLVSLNLPSLTAITDTYTNIDASYYSSDPGALTDVSLPALTSVAGTMVFAWVPIETLDLGLVTRVEGLSLAGTQLTDLNALCGITENGWNLSLYGNTQLTDLSGLQNLTSIEYRLYVRDLPQALECQISRLIADTGVSDIDVTFTLPAACDFDVGACP